MDSKRVPNAKKELESKSILFRGINPAYNEDIIADYLKVYGPIEEIKIVRDRQGTSLGFGFVEFSSLKDAKSCMETTKRVLTIDTQKINLEYSKKQNLADKGFGGTVEFKDWICSNCSANNFSRRTSCFSCKAPKPLNPTVVASYHGTSAHHSEGSGEDHNCVLVVRGLDFNTNEETLWSVFVKYGSVKDIRLIRDKNTGISRGFCYVEFYSKEEASKTLNAIQGGQGQGGHGGGYGGGLKIDGRNIRISVSLPKSQTTASSSFQEQQPTDALASYFASAEDTILLINQGSVNPTRDFVHDPKSGYYYHSSSGLYFEPKNNYYWDSLSSLYYVWDSSDSLYKPLSHSTPTPTTTPSSTPTPSSTSTPAPVVLGTSKNKKISEQLNQWNQKSKELRATLDPSPAPPSSDPSLPTPSLPSNEPTTTTTTNNTEGNSNSGSSSSGGTVGSSGVGNTGVKGISFGGFAFKITAKSTSSSNAASHSQPQPQTQGLSSKPKLFPSFTAQLDDDDDDDFPPFAPTTTTTTTTTTKKQLPFALIKMEKEAEAGITYGNICVLCKRMFEKIPTLRQHLQLSKLHKLNLELKRKSQLLAALDPSLKKLKP